MCFLIDTKYPSEKIAEQDIRCWKIVLKMDDCCRPQYKTWDCRYEKGKLASKVSLTFTDEYIYEGYHSYSDRETALEELSTCVDACSVIRRFVIPKGTTYYYNADKKQYVSECIKMADSQVFARWF
jgi:hypothetical protein